MIKTEVCEHGNEKIFNSIRRVINHACSKWRWSHYKPNAINLIYHKKFVKIKSERKKYALLVGPYNLDEKVYGFNSQGVYLEVHADEQGELEAVFLSGGEK